MTATRKVEKAKPAKEAKLEPARSRWSDVLRLERTAEDAIAFIFIWIELWLPALLVVELVGQRGWWRLLALVLLVLKGRKIYGEQLRKNISDTVERSVRRRYALDRFEDPEAPKLERIEVGPALSLSEYRALGEREHGRVLPVMSLKLSFRPDPSKAKSGQKGSGYMDDFMVVQQQRWRFASLEPQKGDKREPGKLPNPTLRTATLTQEGGPGTVTGR